MLQDVDSTVNTAIGQPADDFQSWGSREMKSLQAWAGEGVVNLVVEAPRGAGAKFKFDQDIEHMTLSRPLPTGLTYPCDWGFIPGTMAEDGDPLDGFALWDGHAYPGIVMRCRPIGVLKVDQTPYDSGKTVRNDRVALVPEKDARMSDVRSVLACADRLRQELGAFFLASVAFEPKRVELKGWGGPEEALRLIKEAAAGHH
jgi:inorganic pyrophosphatase